MATQASSGLDTNTLELIRKQIFGGSPSAQSLDYNSIFGSGSSADLNGLLSTGSNGIGAPAGTNDATADSGIVGNAVIGLLGNVVSSLVATPLSTLALNQTQTIPSTLNLLTQLAHVANSDVSDATAQNAQTFFSITNDPSEEALNSDTDPDADADSGAVSGSPADGPAGESDGVSGSDGSVGSADGGVSGADGSGGGASGGSYAMGGFVPGHDITGSDNVHVNLSGGEFVVPTNIVDMLGKNFFEKLLLTTSPLQDAAEKEAAQMAKSTGN